MSRRRKTQFKQLLGIIIAWQLVGLFISCCRGFVINAVLNIRKPLMDIDYR